MELPKPPASLLARHRQLAPSASVRVSPLCLGAMTFGEAMPERFGTVTKADAFAIMDSFYSQGGNFIDTANGYQHGQSEEWVGDWIAERGVRDEIVLATKYTTPFMGNHMDKIQTNFVGNSAKIQRKTVFEERAKSNPGRQFAPVSSRDKDVSAVLEQIADSKSCELVQVALAYCTQKTPYVFPIVGSRKVEHITGSIDGLKVALSDDEVKQIEKAYPFDHGFPNTFLSGTLFMGENAQPQAANGPEDVWCTRMSGCTFDWVERPKALRPAAQE